MIFRAFCFLVTLCFSFLPCSQCLVACKLSKFSRTCSVVASLPGNSALSDSNLELIKKKYPFQYADGVERRKVALDYLQNRALRFSLDH